MGDKVVMNQYYTLVNDDKEPKGYRAYECAVSQTEFYDIVRHFHADSHVLGFAITDIESNQTTSFWCGTVMNLDEAVRTGTICSTHKVWYEEHGINEVIRSKHGRIILVDATNASLSELLNLIRHQRNPKPSYRNSGRRKKLT